MIGKITSNKMTGTVAVRVERIKIHPLYGKRLRRSQKFLAQTKEKLNIGDQVEIKETRPISRRVKFVVVKVLGRAEVLPQVSEEKSQEKAKPNLLKRTRSKNDSSKK